MVSAYIIINLQGMVNSNISTQKGWGQHKYVYYPSPLLSVMAQYCPVKGSGMISIRTG